MPQSEMMRSPSPAQSSKLPWFPASLIGLFLISLALRFWGLERFNGLVFDEVYYVKFAHNYLTQTPFFDGHPPLSKYLIAIALWIGNQLPIGRDAVNNLAGADYSTWSYRWLNALTGSFMPLVLAGIAYQLTRRPSYALITAAFATLDGLALVESRYALNNLYLVIFGLLGWLFLLVGLNQFSSRLRGLWLLAAGIFFGASLAVKWNGLWFLLGVYGLWSIAQFLPRPEDGPQQLELFANEGDLGAPPPAAAKSPLQHLTRISALQMGSYFGLVPAVFYYLSWIPHLRFNPAASFWELQRQILVYHEQVGNGANIHPYCANWYTWILMLRPVAYFYQITNPGDPLPTGKTPFPTAGDQVIYDVHSMGNPALWWLSTLAIALIFVVLIQRWCQWLATRDRAPVQLPDVPLNMNIVAGLNATGLNATELWLGLFIVINYGANLLPWVRVTRCVFLYHYMASSMFALLGLAWLCDRWLSSRQSRLRHLGIVSVVLVTLGFLFWLPLYLGLPLSPLDFQMRMWLRSWI
jgi:dolichyl-phosphate-mannose-protein mannosyltransferase